MAAAVHRADVRVDRRVRARISVAHRPGAAPPAQVAGAARGRQGATPVPGVPAVACFDTAFHAGMPPAATTYALPREWRKRWDLRRYGFHGLSHAYVARGVTQAAERGRPKTLRACHELSHLGAGRHWPPISSAKIRGHDDGLHAARGPGHGDAVRQRRSRSGALAAGARRHAGPGTGRHARASRRAPGPGRHGRRARSKPPLLMATRWRPGPDVYLHRLRAGIAAMAARQWEGSTRSCSLAVSKGSALIQRRA